MTNAPETTQMRVFEREQVIYDEVFAAIDLYWSRGSIIAANLLAWAAIDQLKSVAKAIGNKTLDDEILDGKTKVEINDWYRMAKSSYNQSKHADRDTFRPLVLLGEVVELAILQATIDFNMCYDKLKVPNILFQSWMFVRSPSLVKSSHQALVADAKRLFGRDQSLTFAESIWAEYKSNPAEFDVIMQSRLGRRPDGSRMIQTS
jgi:hypothetical protein